MCPGKGVLLAILFAGLLSRGAEARGHRVLKAHEETATQESKAPKAAAEEGPRAVLPQRGPARVDFDDRLMQGQSNRLGAVYLYQRKDPSLPSLLDRRKSFRAEIHRDILE